MPLDARITVLIQAPGEYNEHGEYTEGPETPYRRWAQEYGAGSSDQIGQGGTLAVSGRTFLVRWFRALAVAPESFVFVMDSLGQRWYSDGINVGDPRKRYIVIAALRVDTAA